MKSKENTNGPFAVTREARGVQGTRGSDLESDIASVYLARFEGLFDRDALSLHAGPPREGSFLARLGTPAFWSCAACRHAQHPFSKAANFYLRGLFPDEGQMGFDEYCGVWAGSFHAVRQDTESARDLLLLFLDQNLRHLKRLYILAQPHHLDLPPDAGALFRLFDAPENALLFAGGGFARWVLNEWLPFHLRAACCRKEGGEACTHAPTVAVSTLLM